MFTPGRWCYVIVANSISFCSELVAKFKTLYQPEPKKWHGWTQMESQEMVLHCNITHWTHLRKRNLFSTGRCIRFGWDLQWKCYKHFVSPSPSPNQKIEMGWHRWDLKSWFDKVTSLIKPIWMWETCLAMIDVVSWQPETSALAQIWWQSSKLCASSSTKIDIDWHRWDIKSW